MNQKLETTEEIVCIGNELITVMYSPHCNRLGCVQSWYPYTNVVFFTNLPPQELWEWNQEDVVAVWRIKDLY